jgi:hypothetical protein
MKKVAILILSALFLYGIFREFTVVKVLLMAGALAASYLIHRVPGRYMLAMRYPFIALSLLVTAGLFFYPPIRAKLPMEPIVIFFSFYAIAFYLISLDEKGKGLYKEGLALSTLFLAAAFNLFLLGKPLVLVAMSLAIMLFLFIIGRNRLIVVMGCYALGIIVYLLIKKTGISGTGLKMGETDRYLLLAATFALLLFSFTGFLKKPNHLKVLTFFGFIYVALDVLLVVGFKLSAGLLYQPVIALLVLTPLMGMMLKGEGEKI